MRPNTRRKAGSTSWVWVTVDGMAGRRGSAVDHHCIAEPAVRRLALCDAVCNLSDHFLKSQEVVPVAGRGRVCCALGCGVL